MATNDVHRVTVVFGNTVTGKDLTFGYHLREESGGDPSISQIGVKVKAWWNDTQGALTPLKANHSSAITLKSVTRRKINPLSAVIDSYTTGLPIAGTDSGQEMSGNDTLLLSFRTALSGRRYRGRAHMPPMSESFSDGKWTAASSLLYASKTLLLFSLHLSVDAMQAVVYSQPNLVTTPISTPITQVFADQVVRSMRRRQPRTPTYQTGV